MQKQISMYDEILFKYPSVVKMLKELEICNQRMSKELLGYFKISLNEAQDLYNFIFMLSNKIDSLEELNNECKNS